MSVCATLPLGVEAQRVLSRSRRNNNKGRTVCQPSPVEEWAVCDKIKLFRHCSLRHRFRARLYRVIPLPSLSQFACSRCSVLCALWRIPIGNEIDVDDLQMHRQHSTGQAAQADAEWGGSMDGSRSKCSCVIGLKVGPDRPIPTASHCNSHCIPPHPAGVAP